jgi:hypothetical protein
LGCGGSTPLSFAVRTRTGFGDAVFLLSNSGAHCPGSEPSCLNRSSTDASSQRTRDCRNVPRPGCAPETAQQYTRWLATHHYENFNVVSWLLPKELHQHFYNLYAYCRWADDLGDEIPETRRALELLDWWEQEAERLL